MESTPIGRTAAEIRRLLELSPGPCAICRYVSEAMRQHVDKLFYERVTDIPTREAIRKARGFCRPHARLVSEHADALGTAIVLHDVLINELRDLDGGRLDRPPRAARGFARIFDGSQTDAARPRCPLCEVEDDIERLAIDDLLSALHDPDVHRVFGQSSGLCLPHFHLAYARVKDASSWKIVLETQRGALEALTTELAELARKYDYRYQGERVGEESDSWRRALDMTSRRAEM